MQSDDTVQIPLCARDGSIRAYATVDASDAEWAGQFRWYLSGVGYAVRTVRHNVKAYLHRELLGLIPGDGLEGDHRNLDKLDNRRINLRAVPKHGNRQNVPSRRGAASEYRGVYWDARRSVWYAQVGSGGHAHSLGDFASEFEAAEAARVARQRILPFTVD